MKDNLKIIIIGSGSWGTTLSALLANKGYNVHIWTRNQETYDNIKNKRKNLKYTRDLLIPENVEVFKEVNFLFKKSRLIIIFAVPSHALREIIKRFSKPLKLNNIEGLINVAKGFELNTNFRLSEVMSECLPASLKEKIIVLSGPNISSEIAKKLPSVSTISSKNEKLLKKIQPILSTDYFRIYTNNDLVGVEIGGSVKNIIAIASGISDGLGYGTNTKASLVTRGLYELTRFGVKFGANPRTFAGISGMGDLITTCFSSMSRNRNFGERLGKGETADEILSSMYMVAEGINTTKSVFEISKKINIEMPITDCIYDIIYNNVSPIISVRKLMNRKFKSEIESF